MARSAFRTTHTGSLPRPAELRLVKAARSLGELTENGRLDKAGEAAQKTCIERQRSIGLDIVNDGEQCRESFFLHLQHRMSGFGGGWNRPLPADLARHPDYAEMMVQHLSRVAGANGSTNVPEAVGDVTYADKTPLEKECCLLRDTVEDGGGNVSDVFVTAPSPGIVVTAMRNRYYDSWQRYLDAVGEALRVEYETIVSYGFFLQIDAPDLALDGHMAFKDRPLPDFLDFSAAVVEVINRAVQNIPADRIRLHVCWGNYDGPHDCDLGLDRLLPQILNANVGTLVLPFASPRHAHEYRFFETHPLGENQTLVAGVIDPMTNVVEHPMTVAMRLAAIARVIGDRTRVLAGTDCGFDSTAGSGKVAPSVVWSKLASLVEGARIAREESE